MTTIHCTSYSHAAELMGYWQKRGYVTSVPIFDGLEWYITYTPRGEYMEAHSND
ncbi:MAG: hypothetical protein WC455_14355 [Dehalococcoidia bacterium]|jgi:hypothetical protein